MPLPEVAEGVDKLLEISAKVLHVSEVVSKSRTETAQRLAVVLGSITACLDTIASLARKGDHQACCGSCEELGIYLENFIKIEGIPALAGADKIDLLNSLASAVRARRGMYIANSLVGTGRGREVELTNIAEIERAAGRFRAASALVKGEVVRPKGTRAWSRLVLAILIALLSVTVAYVVRR